MNTSLDVKEIKTTGQFLKRSLYLLAMGAFSLGTLGITQGCKTGNKQGIESLGPGDSDVPTIEPNTKPPLGVLTHQEAAIRAKRISHVAYQLAFHFELDRPEFEGTTQVSFDFGNHSKHSDEPLFLEFEAGKITSLTLNGKALEKPNDTKRFDGHRIYLDPSELQTQSNLLKITYNHPYSTDGRGLHHFKDPADGLVYLYSNFEPYDAHKLFPCFDQPDLKATYELTVTAPASWQVVSNTLETSKASDPHDAKEKEVIWNFPKTSVFSTYLFALHAGPYSVWKANANGIPLRLFSRKSLAKYVDYAEWLDVTQKGLEFYSSQFAYPYPFLKYDQLLVPDFNVGAMENVGAVTFSERMVYRTKVTQDRHRARANVILHEMAHMWFGDLVTMKWWNGLWLNESFATLMASWAVDQSTSFKGSWQSFFAQEKRWAYWEDQLITTHPIEVPVPTTDHARSIFDGITYGKGASSLKQLRYYLGEEEFTEGLRRYFQKFAYKNTTLKDFFQMLAEASGKNLKSWQHLWLQTSGVNTARLNWSCNEKTHKISQFDLIQTSSSPLTGESLNQTMAKSKSPSIAPTSGGLRPHRMEIGLYSGKGNKPFILKQTFDVTYEKETTPIPEAIGKPCPQLILLNSQDYDYIKVELDRRTLKQVQASMSLITDPFARQMLWHTLWEMVIDGKLRPQDYANAVLKQGARETNTQVLTTLLQNLGDPRMTLGSVLKYLEEPQRKEFHAKFDTFVRTHLLSAPGGTDIQLVWYQAFVRMAFQSESIQLARQLLSGKRKLKNLPIDQEHRWELLQVLARNNVKDVHSQILAEVEKDATDMGEKSAIAAEAMIPQKEFKEPWLKQILHEEGTITPVSKIVMARNSSQKKLPLAKLREAMKAYSLLDQEKWTENSVDAFFQTLPRMALSPRGDDSDYAIWISELLFPALCSPSIIEKTTALLEKHPNMPPSVIKALKVSRQEEDRCIRARQRSHENELVIIQ